MKKKTGDNMSVVAVVGQKGGIGIWHFASARLCTPVTWRD